MVLSSLCVPMSTFPRETHSNVTLRGNVSGISMLVGGRQYSRRRWFQWGLVEPSDEPLLRLAFWIQRTEALWISRVSFEMVSRRLLKMSYICGTDGLQCTREWMKKERLKWATWIKMKERKREIAAAAAAGSVKAARRKLKSWHSSAGAAHQHIQVALLFWHFHSRLHSHNQGICSLVHWVSSVFISFFSTLFLP